ncbi:MAG: hypothetical protein J3R72DRAFT_7314 [Linnemannia gamsii]|nr:MAG: hypothetical protein J3R72DRAFT_7314 [Linnemannia gamsii]
MREGRGRAVHYGRCDALDMWKERKSERQEGHAPIIINSLLPLLSSLPLPLLALISHTFAFLLQSDFGQCDRAGSSFGWTTLIFFPRVYIERESCLPAVQHDLATSPLLARNGDRKGQGEEQRGQHNRKEEVKVKKHEWGSKGREGGEGEGGEGESITKKRKKRREHKEK